MDYRCPHLHHERSPSVLPKGVDIQCSLHKFEHPTSFTSVFASQLKARTPHNVCIGNPLSQLPNTTLQHAIRFANRFAFCQPATSIQFALGLTSFTPAHHCTVWRSVQSHTASFPHEVRFFLFHRLHQFASLTIVVTRLLVGCLSSLQHPKPPDFHCTFKGTSESNGSTLPGPPKPKGWGPLAPNQCCAPASRCGTPRIERTGDGNNPQSKRLQINTNHQIYTPLHCGRWAH